MAEEVLKKLQEQLDCLGCGGMYTDPKLLGCNHFYCINCLIVAAHGPNLGESGDQREHEQRDLVAQAIEEQSDSNPQNPQQSEGNHQQEERSIHCPCCFQVTTSKIADLKSAVHINKLLEVLSSAKKIVTLAPSLKATAEVCFCPEHVKEEMKVHCETCVRKVCLECVFEGGKHHQHSHTITLTSTNVAAQCWRLKNGIEELLKCLVCHDTYADPRMLRCFHIFCRQCVVSMVSYDEWNHHPVVKCPICRDFTRVVDLQLTLSYSLAVDLLHLINSSVLEGIMAFQFACCSDSEAGYFCSEHGEKIKLFCISCGLEPICFMCASKDGKHHGHTHKRLKAVDME